MRRPRRNHSAAFKARSALRVNATARGLNDLDWFAGWRPWVWSRAVRGVLGDPARFNGKRVLELGYRTGRMSCYFGLLGATVHGMDLPDCKPQPAVDLANSLDVADRVSFGIYDGDLEKLEAGRWDFVFTKSVLVLLPIEWAAPAIRRLLAPGGQYLGCENLVLPFGLNQLRNHQVGVNDRTFEVMAKHFSHVEVKSNLGLIASVVASA